MNILWDFRLFSTGYKNRGVGTYTKSLASPVYNDLQENLFILGKKADLPEEIQHWKCTFIEYGTLNWKTDLLTIPYIIRKYKINLIHYWVGLGPLYQIGFGLFHTCPAIATIYDMGVEQWDLPYLSSTKKSLYWRIQKILSRFLTHSICISESSRNDLLKVFPAKKNSSSVAYIPIDNTKQTSTCKRQPYFITLGGSSHKNCGRVAAAFSKLRTEFPGYKLIILGTVNRHDENLENTADTVFFEETMKNYQHHLKNSQGLLFTSLYEGLGVPPLEALTVGCPLLLSNIPPLIETCKDAACFTDPFDEFSIELGIRDLIKNNTFWVNKSVAGREVYTVKCRNSASGLVKLYNNLTQSA